MNDSASLCQTCWAEGQILGKPCWLCHSVAKPIANPKPKAATEDEPFRATAVEGVLDDADMSETSLGNPYAPPVVVEETGVYQLSSVLLAAMLVLICSVMCFSAPGLGIPVSIIILPALIRTAMTSKREHARGKPQTFLATLSMFFFSAAAAVAAAVAAALACIGALLSACFAICFGSRAIVVDFDGNIINVVFGVCVLGSVAAGIYLFLQLTKTSNR